MRVAFVSTFELPSAETSTEQFVRTADALGGAGVTVDLIVPRSGRACKAPEMHSLVSDYYHVEGRFKVKTYSGPPPLALEAERAINAVSLLFRRWGAYDIVHTKSRGVLLAAVLKRLPVVFETYRALPSTNPFFSGLVRRLLKRRSFLGVICHSEYAARALASIGADTGKVKVAYNGYDPSLMLPALTKQQARKLLGLRQDDLVAVYLGNVQSGKGISFLLELAKHTSDVKWLIVGGQQAHLERLRRLVKEGGLANVTPTGRKKPEAFAQYLYAADILIIPPTSAPLERYGRTVLPMKTFLYLAAGRPIVAPDTPDIREILTDQKTALLTDPDNVDGACKALSDVFKNKKLAENLSENCKSLARQYTWGHRARRILRFYDVFFNLAAGKSSAAGKE